MDVIDKPLEGRVAGYCRNQSDIVRFFQEMVYNGESMAYSVEIDKQIVEVDTEAERVVRTIKGATLTPITEISLSLASHNGLFLEDPSIEAMHYMHIYSRSHSSDFVNVEHRYGWCDITGLVKNPDLRKLRKPYNGINIPEEMAHGRLHYKWDDDIGEEGIKSGYLRIEGEQDSLFAKVAEFVGITLPS